MSRHAKVFRAVQFYTLSTLGGIVPQRFGYRRSFCLIRMVPNDYRPRHGNDDWWSHRPRLVLISERLGWYRQGNPWPSPEYTHGMNRWLKGAER